MKKEAGNEITARAERRMLKRKKRVKKTLERATTKTAIANLLPRLSVCTRTLSSSEQNEHDRDANI